MREAALCSGCAGTGLPADHCLPCRYEKYTTAKESKVPMSSDQFTQAYAELIERVNDLNLVCARLCKLADGGARAADAHKLSVQKADEITKEFNRATKAALNAEQR